MSNKSLKSEFDKWKQEYQQHGKQAFPKFMMLNFLKGLEDISDEFVFKGGNLLWHYIQTPRVTVDLDLSTLTLDSHEAVKDSLERSFKLHNKIVFSIKEYKEVDREGKKGAKLVIGYKTSEGQRNVFGVDIVFALPTDLSKVKSTLGGVHKAASIENIIADKVSAAYQFASGNTRIKDFDDLWRISKSEQKISKTKLRKLFKEKEIDFYLNPDWSQTMKIAWEKHAKKYGDLPTDIISVFNEVNGWLSRFK